MIVQIRSAFGWRSVTPWHRGQFEIDKLTDAVCLAVDGRRVRQPWRVLAGGRVIGSSR